MSRASQLLRRDRLLILLSPGFLIGLLLLLLNDWVFKPVFGGGLITGKLSDLAGLFIFPLFWFSLIGRGRRVLFLLTGVLFVFWKSPWSGGLILVWNDWLWPPIYRVVDPTDLLALLMLPLSYGYLAKIWPESTPRPRSPRRRGTLAVAALSLAAFVATSMPPPSAEYGGKTKTRYSHRVELGKEEVLQKLQDGGHDVHHWINKSGREFIKVPLQSMLCGEVEAILELREPTSNATLMRLIRIVHPTCDEKKENTEKLLLEFQDFVATDLLSN